MPCILYQNKDFSFFMYARIRISRKNKYNGNITITGCDFTLNLICGQQLSDIITEFEDGQTGLKWFGLLANYDLLPTLIVNFVTVIFVTRGRLQYNRLQFSDIIPLIWQIANQCRIYAIL